MDLQTLSMLLTLAAAPSAAADWAYVGTEVRADAAGRQTTCTVAIDRKSLAADGDRVKAWRRTTCLRDVSYRLANGRKVLYREAKSLTVADCATRGLGDAAHYAYDPLGRRVDRRALPAGRLTLAPAAPGSEAERWLHASCGLAARAVAPAAPVTVYAKL